MKVYEELRKIREERGLTLSRLAEQVGTDHQSISRLKRGKDRFTLNWLMKITTALDAPMERMFEGTKSLSTRTESFWSIFTLSGACPGILERLSRS